MLDDTASSPDPRAQALGDARAAGPVSSSPPRPDGDGWRLEWVPVFDEDAGGWAGDRELDWVRDATDDEIRDACELIARAGVPDYPAPVHVQPMPRNRQRARARRTARRPRKPAGKSDDGEGEPPRPRGVLIEADARRAQGLPSSGPRFRYEWRDCEACGREFKNYWADFEPMSSCSACCQACQDNGDCPRCGADACNEDGAE